MRYRICETDEMERRTIGWVFVAAQVALLLLLIATPSGDDWSTGGWVTAVGWAISIGGAAFALIAGLRLGTSLTPTPVPTQRGELTTTGLYGVVRHPIYTGVLAVVLGLAVRSGSVVTAIVGLAIFGFFGVKARWEEQQLRDWYDGYAEYAAVTPRFVPNPFRGTR